MQRILDLLELVVVSDGRPLTLTEISLKAQTPLSTTSRLLAQLVSWGYLQANSDDQLIPGARLARMSVMVTAQFQSTDVLLRSTEALSAATGESVTGGLLIQDTIVIVARTESDHPLRVVSRVGELISPTRTALGNMVMSELPRERQLGLLKAAGVSTALEELEEIGFKLRAAKKNGYALDDGIFNAGLRCCAVAILDREGKAVGGISIGGPVARFTQALTERAIPLLVEESRRLSLNFPNSSLPSSVETIGAANSALQRQRESGGAPRAHPRVGPRHHHGS